MIKIIAVGNLKEDYLKAAEKEYKKRLSKFTSLEIIEIKESNKIEESSKIKEKIKANDYVIILDIKGKQYSSEDFAMKIDKLFTYGNPNLTFIIGGSNGVEKKFKTIANELISFSKMTIPHQLFRINLLEQIYRAYKITNNEPYHK